VLCRNGTYLHTYQNPYSNHSSYAYGKFSFTSLPQTPCFAAMEHIYIPTKIHIQTSFVAPTANFPLRHCSNSVHCLNVKFAVGAQQKKPRMGAAACIKTICSPMKCKPYYSRAVIAALCGGRRINFADTWPPHPLKRIKKPETGASPSPVKLCSVQTISSS
jgi:hypothetical protein